MTTTPHSTGPDHPLERLVFFSDAVFAIAITLMVIEIDAPHVPAGSPHTAYLLALVRLLPSLFSFFVSFWVVSAFWAGHHRAFALAGHYSPSLNFPNLALLCAVVFIPFATAFMGRNIGTTVPTALYNATLIVTGLLNMHLVRKVTAPPVVAEHVTHDQIVLARIRSWGVTLGAALAFIVSFIDPRFSEMALITIPLWIRLLKGQAQRRLAREAQAAG